MRTISATKEKRSYWLGDIDCPDSGKSGKKDLNSSGGSGDECKKNIFLTKVVMLKISSHTISDNPISQPPIRCTDGGYEDTICCTNSAALER